MLSTMLKSKINSLKSNKSEDCDEAEADVSQKPNRNEYSRPCFLELTEDDFQASYDHDTRPIIVPKSASALPWNAGYAECVSSHMKLNEDQAAVGRVKLNHQLTPEQTVICPGGSPAYEASLHGVFYGVFDGHGGTGAALMVADQLINHLQEKLVDVRKELFDLALKEYDRCQSQSQSPDHAPPSASTPAGDVVPKCEEDPSAVPSEDTPMEQATPVKQATPMEQATSTDTATLLDPPTLNDCVTFDDLVTGALEAAFHSMDEQIGGEKGSFNITGGCCTLVALFLHGKLYVANAGDCRAVAYLGDQVIPLSTDFSADQDSDRIYTLARHHPELTQGMFAVSQFHRYIHKADIGQRMLWRPPGTVGWCKREVTNTDANFPLIQGSKKRSRLMNCIGVSRSLGDYDLTDVYTKLPVKPFLSCTPEVQVLDLSRRSVTATDVVVMGSDGLWDVVSNQVMGHVVRQTVASADQQKDRYTQAAAAAVLKARGERDTSRPGWNPVSGEEPSHDDITAFVIPLLLAPHATRLILFPA